MASWQLHPRFPMGNRNPSHDRSLKCSVGIHKQSTVKWSALASVLAFFFLHQVRFGGLLDAGRPNLKILNPEHSYSEDGATPPILVRCGNSRPPQAGFMLAASHGCGEELAWLHIMWAAEVYVGNVAVFSCFLDMGLVGHRLRREQNLARRAPSAGASRTS
jgi:hypothetical protein